MARNATTAKPSYLKLLRPELNLKRPNVREVQSECRKAYYSHIDSMITSDETEPGNLKRSWSFIKSKKYDNSGVAPLKIDGVAHSDSGESQYPERPILISFYQRGHIHHSQPWPQHPP